MLGKLARHLRIFGFDTIYSADLDDDQILRLAREGRAIVTRDRRLAERAWARGLKAFLTRSTDLEQELRELVNARLVKKGELKIGARCSLCNSELLERRDRTWVCPKCGQRYWIGGHWANISKLMMRVGLLDEHQ